VFRNELILNLFSSGAGRGVGLSAALSGGLYEETAQAIAPCRAVVLRCEDFERFLKEHPSACSAVIREMGVQYEQACARLRLTATSTAQARLAQLLLDWAETAPQTEYGIRIQVGLTHGEIGECIGVSRASVTRILSDLQRRRIVELRGSILTISNRAALESRADPARLPSSPSNLVMMSGAKMKWSGSHRPETSPA
jgi:CRP-like cAMP-binding protein